jgi:hypothetical protein
MKNVEEEKLFLNCSKNSGVITKENEAHTSGQNKFDQKTPRAHKASGYACVKRDHRLVNRTALFRALPHNERTAPLCFLPSVPLLLPRPPSIHPQPPVSMGLLSNRCCSESISPFSDSPAPRYCSSNTSAHLIWYVGC